MIEILPELLKKKRKRIDEINQVGTAGELLDFVKNNKESKVIFKEDDNLYNIIILKSLQESSVFVMSKKQGSLSQPGETLK